MRFFARISAGSRPSVAARRSSSRSMTRMASGPAGAAIGRARNLVGDYREALGPERRNSVLRGQVVDRVRRLPERRSSGRRRRPSPCARRGRAHAPPAWPRAGRDAICSRAWCELSMNSVRVWIHFTGPRRAGRRERGRSRPPGRRRSSDRSRRRCRATMTRTLSTGSPRSAATVARKANGTWCARPDRHGQRWSGRTRRRCHASPSAMEDTRP